ncbi:MAG TPA: hypothetical protein VH396_09860 [Chitinophagaceae bacterium]|jgi:hypothetical protein
MKALALAFILLVLGIVYTVTKIVTALTEETDEINMIYSNDKKAPQQISSNALYLFWCLPD